ncbi:MAG: nucleotidyltransferase family protein [Halioglobus sp.]
MSLLTEVLAAPERIDELSGAQWDELLRLARFSRLLGRLHALVEERGNLEQIPLAAREVLVGASIYTQYVQLLARRVLFSLNQVVDATDFPVVLLKGAAYLMSGLPSSVGRRMNDIDILVPHEKLPQMESLLERAGWGFEVKLTAYDHRYYREWSHELPPMRHSDSPIELDVHHSLIQPTGRIKFNSDRLFADLVSIDGMAFSTLSPPDMVLHSATHLFMSDELRGGLRDLVDMHMLCNYFAERDSGYWEKLTARAEELGLQRPLYYAVAAMRRIFRTAIPGDVWETIATARPGWLADWVMRRAIDRHLAPGNMAKLHSWYAQRLLYLRSHWIRMPPLMLAKHLCYKWWAGFRAPDVNAGDA